MTATVHTLPVRGPYGRLERIERVIVLGISFSGKTVATDQLLAEARRRVFFTLSHEDFCGQGRTETTVAELYAHPELLKGDDICLVVRAQAETENAIAREAILLIRLLRKACAAETDKRVRGLGYGGCVVVFDDVGNYRDGWVVVPTTDPSNPDGEEKRSFADELSDLGRNGRHHHLVTVAVSQSYMDIPKGFRRQATRIISLVQTNDDDLKELRKDVGREGGEKFARRVAAWKPGDAPVEWVIPTLTQLTHRQTKGAVLK